MTHMSVHLCGAHTVHPTPRCQKHQYQTYCVHYTEQMSKCIFYIAQFFYIWVRRACLILPRPE